jgi:hypothetical protein
MDDEGVIQEAAPASIEGWGAIAPPIEPLLPLRPIGDRAKLAEIDDPMEMFADRLE